MDLVCNKSLHGHLNISTSILGCAGVHLAAQFGHSSIVAYLLSKGVVCNIRSIDSLKVFNIVF